MNARSLLTTIENNGKGGNAYAQACRQAQQAVIAEPHHATIYFLLTIAADSFLTLHGTQPINARTADTEFDQFAGYVQQLEAAVSDGSDGALLSALNQVAEQIVQHRMLADAG